jgi:FeS assembly SUF system regulator
MVRISRLTDYAIQLMAELARAPQAALNARDLSGLSGTPEPTVRKLLKSLVRARLLVSTRGVRGGYRLGRAAQEITVAQIIAAIEGPIAVTRCNEPGEETCERKASCPLQQNWRQVNQAIHGALSNLTLSNMAGTLPADWTGGGSR